MGTTLANTAEEALVSEAERSPATHHAGREARRCALGELSLSGFSYSWRHRQSGAALLHGLFSLTLVHRGISRGAATLPSLFPTSLEMGSKCTEASRAPSTDKGCGQRLRFLGPDNEVEGQLDRCPHGSALQQSWESPQHPLLPSTGVAPSHRKLFLFVRPCFALKEPATYRFPK